ncbi:glycosyltransferase family 39 protein [Anaerolineales bacterium HSG6]|nr:glycosyltransferase family 39 protein [Anaerolineales bacterium HSG6]
MTSKNNQLILLGAVLLPIFIVAMPIQAIRLSATILLVGFLPGYSILSAFYPTLFTPLERTLLASALSWAITALLLFLFILLGIPIQQLSVLIGLSGLTLFGVAVAAKSSTAPTSNTENLKYPKGTTSKIQNPKSKILTIVLILLSLFFNTYNLHYSDFQGDEAGVLLQSVAVLQGHTDIIMTRFKGPGEVMIMAAVGSLTDNMDEFSMRFPFAVAGAVSVGLIFLLGRTMVSLPVGLIAAILAIIDGMNISHARTAQYQTTQLLLILATVFCFYRFYQTKHQSLSLHMLGSFCFAVVILFHFETLFLLPVIVYLTLPSIGSAGILPASARRAENGHYFFIDSQARRQYLAKIWQTIHPLWPSAIIFLLITASFHVPFLLHPSIDGAGTYLEGRIGSGAQPPFNNFAHFFHIEALKYNAIYYVLFINLSLLGMVLVGCYKGLDVVTLWRAPLTKQSKLGWVVGSMVLLGLIYFGLTSLGWFRLAITMLALAVGLLFTMLIVSPAFSHAQRTLILWAVPASWVFLFLVRRPGKHHYIVWSAVLLLIGLAVMTMFDLLNQRLPLLRRQKSMLWGGVGLILWLVCAFYTSILFLRVEWEYMLTYPEHALAAYPVDSAYPYGTRIGFGYPYRLGWQTVGQLQRAGQLDGTWTANDKGNSLDWYMVYQQQTRCYPDYIMTGEITYKDSDEYNPPFQPEQFGYRTKYRIYGNDRLRLTVQQFDPDGLIDQPLDLHEPHQFEQSISPADFLPIKKDLPPVPPTQRLDPAPVLAEGSELINNAPSEYLERTQYLDGRVALIGYDMQSDYQTMLPITLHWYTEQTPNLRYKVFVHLLDENGQVVAQADDFPVCGTSHVNSWLGGSITLDRHLLHLPPDLSAGTYDLRIGMYEPELNLRLNYLDIANNEQGNSLFVDDVYTD